MMSKILSVEYKSDKILVTGVHPGYVQTGMGGPLATMTTLESVTGILTLASTFNETNSGMNYAWDGTLLSW